MLNLNVAKINNPITHKENNMSIVKTTFDASTPHVGIIDENEFPDGTQAVLLTGAVSPLLDDSVKWFQVPPSHPHLANQRVHKVSATILNECPLCSAAGCIQAETTGRYIDDEGEKQVLHILHCRTSGQFGLT
jgi:hypothetical protein